VTQDFAYEFEQQTDKLAGFLHLAGIRAAYAKLESLVLHVVEA
jgi:hypothetical protein